MTALPDVAIRALLDERSLALSRRGRVVVRESARESFLVCSAGESLFGFPVAEIAGISARMPCRPLPDAPRAVLGIIAFSGGIVSVLDLALAVGIEGGHDVEGESEPRHFVRLRGRQAAIALAVDRALGLVHVSKDVLAASLPGGPDAAKLGGDAVSGYAPPGSAAAEGVTAGFVILDVPRLIGRYLP